MKREQLERELRGLGGVAPLWDEPVSRHGNLRLGGPVELYAVVFREEALPPLLSALRRAGVTSPRLAAGFDELLAREEGLSGAVVRLAGDFCRLEERDGALWAGAAVPLARIGARARALGLSRLARLERSPGTLLSWVAERGAEALAPLFTELRVLHRGRLRDWPPERAAELGARGLLLGGLLSGELPRGLELPPPPGAVARLDRRLRRELEREGLLGLRLRRVSLAREEPGVVVNLGGARSRDLEAVLALLRDRLERDRRIAWRLQPAGRPAGRR